MTRPRVHIRDSSTCRVTYGASKLSHNLTNGKKRSYMQREDYYTSMHVYDQQVRRIEVCFDHTTEAFGRQNPSTMANIL